MENKSTRAGSVCPGVIVEIPMPQAVRRATERGKCVLYHVEEVALTGVSTGRCGRLRRLASAEFGIRPFRPDVGQARGDAVGENRRALLQEGVDAFVHIG